jgi:hypothetical protein
MEYWKVLIVKYSRLKEWPEAIEISGILST